MSLGVVHLLPSPAPKHSQAGFFAQQGTDMLLVRMPW